MTDLRRDILLPFNLRMIKIVHWESKWFSRNNRRLWCFREAVVVAVQVLVGSTDSALLRGSTTCTDGLSVVFYLPCVCKTCGEKSVNCRGLHNHDCQRKVDSAAPSARGLSSRLVTMLFAQKFLEMYSNRLVGF